MPSSITFKDEALQDYADAKFTLFPCKLDKRPFTGWQSTAYNAHPVMPSPMNGVLLTDTDFVLDFDPKRGETHLTDLWERTGLQRAETFIVSTPSGGYHLYFKMHAGTLLRAKVPGYDALEVKSKGKYVIAAGSVREDGKSYTYARHKPGFIAPVPPALLALCIRPPEEELTFVPDMDDDATQRRFIVYLMHTSGAIQGEEGDRKTYLAACEGLDYGLSPGMTLKLLTDYFNPRCVPEWTDDELEQKVRNALAYRQNKVGRLHPSNDWKGQTVPVPESPMFDDWWAIEKSKEVWNIRMTKDGVKEYQSTMNNAVNLFLVDPDSNPLFNLLRYNVFTMQTEFIRRAPWHNENIVIGTWGDIDDVMLRLFFSKKKNFHISKEMGHDAASAVSYLNKYHPLKDWLSALVWDGEPRVNMMLTNICGAEPTPYHQAVGRCTLVGMVARIFDPGCQHDAMMILEGKQNAGKSSFCNILGGAYYADMWLDPRAKDTVSAMRGKWAVEISEMAAVKNAKDVSDLKAFITRRTDEIRLPYGRNETIMPRQSVFIGTVNPNKVGYLTDPTGNRRYWPVTCGTFDLDRLRVERDQIFAEAVHMYQAGVSNYMDTPDLITASEDQQQLRVDNYEPWLLIVEDWYNKMCEMGTVPEVLTSEAIGYSALGLSPAQTDKHKAARLNQVMFDLDFFKQRKRVGGIQSYVWTKNPLS